MRAAAHGIEERVHDDLRVKGSSSLGTNEKKGTMPTSCTRVLQRFYERLHVLDVLDDLPLAHAVMSEPLLVRCKVA